MVVVVKGPTRVPAMLRIRPLPFLRAASAATLLCVAAPPASAGSITGVCPDGSIFIAPRDELIPCRGAKKIEPDEVPPMRPEYLPRPYTWQVYQEGNDPNNAYNLVEQARRVRRMREGLPPVEAGPEARAQAQEHAEARPLARTERAPDGPFDLGLTDGELRDLYFIVELNQTEAPAAFVKENAAGSELMVVSLAHSSAFEERLAQAFQRRGRPMGPALLFTAVARAPEDFYANFTFSQGPLAFQPKVDDPLQFGVIQGRLGPMDRNTAVLGYVVLPDVVDLTAPMDVYWNDRRIEVVLSPLSAQR
jgi:hypothetical protein